jgi:thiamine pyrophosphokinase
MLLAPRRYEIPAAEGFSLSLFSYGERVGGLSISGTKYTLQNGEIDNAFPIGISNEIVGEAAQIEFESGLLLVVQSRL